jgi:triosephosphate isomerase
VSGARTPLLAGNWKMCGARREAVALATALAKVVAHVADREILVAPPYTALEAVGHAIAGTGIRLGAQNLYWEAKGAFTGEISAAMLCEAGCTHVIIGHSERRQLFGETNETVHKRLGAALAAGLTPIVCVGETLQEREADATVEVVERQVVAGLAGISAADLARSVVAYEPVWAIGTGRTATPNQAQAVHRTIRDQLAKLADPATAERVRILYGGSVKPDNIDSLMAEPDIDGALVGGASLVAEQFSRIVRFEERKS